VIPRLSTPPKRILLIRLRGIGDVILSTPLFRALRKVYPEAQIHLLTRSFCEPVARDNPYLNKVIVHPETSVSLWELLKFVWTLRTARYDWVLDLAAEPRSAWLTVVTGAPLRAGYAFRIRKWAFNYRIPKNKIRKYQGEINLDIIRALGVTDDGSQTELFLQPSHLQWAERAWVELESRGDLKRKIGINPTGMWSSKRWPADYWRRLISLIHDRWGIAPVLLGGPGDGEILEEIRWGMGEKALVKPESGLLEAAAFISKMDLLIGNDGTPQHLAQALGAKSLTLCGPHWGIGWTRPNDIRHRYLQHFLDCGPCDFNLCPFPRVAAKGGHVHQECLLKITPDKVLAVAQEMLGI
jgi:heptosyltransferase III